MQSVPQCQPSPKEFILGITISVCGRMESKQTPSNTNKHAHTHTPLKFIYPPTPADSTQQPTANSQPQPQPQQQQRQRQQQQPRRQQQQQQQQRRRRRQPQPPTGSGTERVVVAILTSTLENVVFTVFLTPWRAQNARNYSVIWVNSQVFFHISGGQKNDGVSEMFFIFLPQFFDVYTCANFFSLLHLSRFSLFLQPQTGWRHESAWISIAKQES